MMVISNNRLKSQRKETQKKLKSLGTPSDFRRPSKLLAKRIITKPKSKRLSGKLFIKSSDTAVITEDNLDRPIFEQRVRTYKVTKIKKKFIIFEMNRKSKPKRLRTITMKKGERLDDIIRKVQHGKIKLREKNITFTGTNNFKIIQTNYKAKIKSRPQLVGLVLVIDIKNGLSDYFVGYSFKINNAFPTNADIKQAKNEIINMAERKFASVYGTKELGDKIDKLKSGAVLKTSEFIFESRIIELRFQYYTRPKHIVMK